MEKFKVGGYLSGAEQVFSENFKNLIRSQIEENRLHFIQEHREQFRREDEILIGPRFRSNQAVLVRVLSGIIKADNPSRVYPKINFKIEEQETPNIKQWIWAALLDCAESDHYYEREKRWDD